MFKSCRLIQKRFLQSYLEVWAGEQLRHLHVWMSATIADEAMSDGAVWKLTFAVRRDCTLCCRDLHQEFH